jgi:hypothetical protein
MPNRTEGTWRKPSHIPTGRLPSLRLFSTLLAVALFDPVLDEEVTGICANALWLFKKEPRQLFRAILGHFTNKLSTTYKRIFVRFLLKNNFNSHRRLHKLAPSIRLLAPQ